MKQIKMKYALLTATLLCNAGLAMAHDLQGSLASASTDATKSKVDFYQVTCSGGTAKLEAQVRDASPPDSSLVSIQLKKANAIASSQDGIAGDANYGVKISVSGGDAVYDMFLNRSGKLAQNYNVSYHCLSGTGGHTNTAIATRQNQ